MTDDDRLTLAPPHVPVTLGEHLREARRRAGLTMGDVADALRCSVPDVSDIERDMGRVPFVALVSDFARLVGANVTAMLGLREYGLSTRVRDIRRALEGLSPDECEELLRRVVGREQK